MADFYPTSFDAQAAWVLNFAKHLGDFQSKYGISAATITQVAEDNAWMQFWVPYRHAFDASSQQLTKFFNTIAGNSESPEAPLAFDVPPVNGPPAQPPPGIEKRIRDIASFIKGNKAVYSEADGELLGIVGSDKTKDAVDTIIAEFTLTTQAEFKLKADFKKKGTDGIKFEYRHTGGPWTAAGVLLTSGGRFTVPPSQPGVAEQVEVRGIYIVGNDNVGNFSDAKQAFIAP